VLALEPFDRDRAGSQRLARCRGGVPEQLVVAGRLTGVPLIVSSAVSCATASSRSEPSDWPETVGVVMVGTVSVAAPNPGRFVTESYPADHTP